MSIQSEYLKRIKSRAKEIVNIEDKFMIFQSELKNYYYYCIWDKDADDWEISESKIDTFTLLHLRSRKYSMERIRKGLELTSDGVVDIVINKNSN